MMEPLVMLTILTLLFWCGSLARDRTRFITDDGLEGAFQALILEFLLLLANDTLLYLLKPVEVTIVD
jgi:hypothetical protein